MPRIVGSRSRWCAIRRCAPAPPQRSVAPHAPRSARVLYVSMRAISGPMRGVACGTAGDVQQIPTRLVGCGIRTLRVAPAACAVQGLTVTVSKSCAVWSRNGRAPLT